MPQLCSSHYCRARLWKARKNYDQALKESRASRTSSARKLALPRLLALEIFSYELPDVPAVVRANFERSHHLIALWEDQRQGIRNGNLQQARREFSRSNFRKRRRILSKTRTLQSPAPRYLCTMSHFGVSCSRYFCRLCAKRNRDRDPAMIAVGQRSFSTLLKTEMQAR